MQYYRSTMGSENSNSENLQDEEITLIDLFAVIVRYRFLIIFTTAAAMVLAVLAAFISIKLPSEKSFLPNYYTPSALMLINDADSSSGISSLLSSSGLGGLAGISSKGASNSSLALCFVETNTFLDSIVEKFNLVERYKIKKFPKTSSRKALLKNLSAKYNDASSIFSISFTDIDPVFAQEVVNYAVNLIEEMFLNLGIDKNALEKKNLEQNIENSYNEILKLQKKTQQLESSVSYGSHASSIPAIMMETTMVRLELEAQQQVYTQLKTQYELLKIKMASETPVFQVIEKAEVPDKKSKPGRGMLCIVISFAAFFFSVFLAFVLNAVSNVKKDADAMDKLRSARRK